MTRHYRPGRRKIAAPTGLPDGEARPVVSSSNSSRSAVERVIEVAEQVNALTARVHITDSDETVEASDRTRYAPAFTGTATVHAAAVAG